VFFFAGKPKPMGEEKRGPVRGLSAGRARKSSDTSWAQETFQVQSTLRFLARNDSRTVSQDGRVGCSRKGKLEKRQQLMPETLLSQFPPKSKENKSKGSLKWQLLFFGPSQRFVSFRSCVLAIMPLLMWM